MKKRVLYFWQRAPALYYALSLLVAILFMLKSPWPLLFLFLFSWGREVKSVLFGLILFLATISYLQHTLYFPPTQSKGIFRFQIYSTSSPSKSFQKGSLYKGSIREIVDQKGERKLCKLPASLYINHTLSLDHEYWIEGVLDAKNRGCYFIRASSAPIIYKKNITLCKIKEESKRWFISYIHRCYKGELTAPFLIALTTGKNEDPLLKGHLTQIGCAHLLAISGFHFALIAAFFHFLLKPFLPYKIHTFLLIGLLLCYLLFIGKSASIYRAFIFASCFLLAPIFERRSSPINTLGISLAICLIIDPMMAIEVGFQLSFLATGAILILYPKVKNFIVSEKDRGLLLFFAKAAALNIAIHFALIPLTLLYFHSINIHSMLYNLFFPSLTALSLLLFISATSLHPLLPPLAKAIHFVNGYITEHFLYIAEKRVLYEKTFFLEGIASWALVLFFVMLYGFALTTCEEEIYEEQLLNFSKKP